MRYLEKAFWNLDIEQYNLVQEALSERYTVLKVAPYLTTALPIMCPIYKYVWEDGWLPGVGLVDLLEDGGSCHTTGLVARRTIWSPAIVDSKVATSSPRIVPYNSFPC